MSKYISRISAKNWQGGTFEYQLEPITAIIGPNFSGKTAIAHAITVGLLGYSPKHGKRPMDTFGFIGGKGVVTSGGISLDTSDGEQFAHSWTFAKRKVIYDGQAMDGIPPVLLDAAEYMSLSGPDKTRYVFNLIDLEQLGFTIEKLTASVKKGCQIEEPTEHTEAALNDVISEIENQDETRHDMGTTWQTMMSQIVEWVKKKGSDAKTVLDNMTGAIQASGQLRADETPVRFDAQKLIVTRARLKTLGEDRRALKEKKDSHGFKESRRRELKDTLSNLNALKIPDLSGQRARKKTIKEKLEGYVFKSGVLQVRIDSMTSEITRLTKASTDGKHARKVAVLAKEKQFAGVCPHCGEAAPKPKAKLKCCFWAGKADALKGADERILAIEKQYIADDERISEIEEERAKVVTERDEAKVEDAAMEKLQTELTEIDESLDAASDHEADLSKVRGQIEELGEPTELEADIDGKLLVFDDEIAKENATLSALCDAEKNEHARQGDEKRMAQARAERETKEAEVMVCKLVCKVLLEEQGTMTEKAFVGFMASANELAGGILSSPLEFRDGEIGRYDGANWVGLSHFSGTEDLLAMAGLSLCLAAQSPFKLVILDEMGRLTSDNKLKVLQRVKQLVDAGKIHQVIMIDVGPMPYAGFDWVHRVELAAFT